MKTPRLIRDPRLLAIRKRPINVLASVLTTTSLYLGVLSIFASIGQEFDKAAYLIMAAIIFDSLDGSVARATKTVSEFGKELDSLCDMVSFGVAPGVLVFCAYLPETAWLPDIPDKGSFVGRTGSFVAIVFAICAALRLARFNTFQSDRRDSFIGLPSPAAGAAVASFVVFLQFLEPRLETHKLGAMSYYLLGPVALVAALLMVSTVRYPKNRLKHFVMEPNHAFSFLGIWAFVIVIVHYAVTKSPAIVLFPVICAYILFGLGDSLYNWITGKNWGETAATEEVEAAVDDESEDEEDAALHG